MNSNGLLLNSCLTIAAVMIPATHPAMAEDEASWGISGWINEGLTYYNDGDDGDVAQLSDNGTTLGSRITFSGNYKPPKTNLDTGFEVIIEPLSGVPNFAGGGSITPLLFSNQDDLDTFNGGDVGVLGSSVHIGGSWGKFTIGLQSMPTDNIAVLADPSGTIWSGISPVFRGNGFFIRGLGAGASNTTWGSFLQCLTTPGLGIGIDCNGVYRNGLRYDLPELGDFSVAVGYANDEIYDIALKYDSSFSGFNTNVNLGYAVNKDGGTNVGATDAEIFQLQAGLMHDTTGVFGLITYQQETADEATAGSGDDTDAWYLKAGIKKGWFATGKTALYVDYGSYNDQFGAGNDDGISGSEVQRIGAAVVQDLGDKLKVYGKWEQLSLDIEGTTAANAIYNSAEDLDTVTLGVTYLF